MTMEKWFFLFISFIVLYLFWRVIQPFILVLIFSGVTTIIISPLERKIRKRIEHTKISSAIITGSVFFFFFVPLFTMLFLMATQASDLFKSAVLDISWLNHLKSSFDPFIHNLPPTLQNEIASFDISVVGKGAANWMFQNIGKIFSSTTQLVLNTFIFFLSLYYFLVNRESLHTEMLNLSPLANEIDEKLFQRIINTIRSVVFGVMMVALIQGTVAGIGMLIFGVPGSLLWGALAGLAGLIPLLGTSLVLIPAILYLFIGGSVLNAIGLLVWSVVFVSTIDNIVSPFLIGKKAQINSFLVLISVLGGIAAFGSVGAFAGPCILAALLGLIEVYKSGILTTGKLNKPHKPV